MWLKFGSKHWEWNLDKTITIYWGWEGIHFKIKVNDNAVLLQRIWGVAREWRWKSIQSRIVEGVIKHSRQREMWHGWGRWKYWYWLCGREEVFPGKSRYSGVSVVQSRNQSDFTHISQPKRSRCVCEHETPCMASEHTSRWGWQPLSAATWQSSVLRLFEPGPLYSVGAQCCLWFWLAVVGKRRWWERGIRVLCHGSAVCWPV